MREVQKLRWAKVKGQVGAKPVQAASKVAATQRGGLTPAGRKALSLAMKKRWAVKKA